MRKILKISLLLALAWIFFNVGPILLGAFWPQEKFFDGLLYCLSGKGWYWGIHKAAPVNILVGCSILIYSLYQWLRRPSIRNASLLIAVGPALGVTSFLYLSDLFLLMVGISGLTVLAGQVLQACWNNRHFSRTDPYAPMPTYHH